MGGIFELGSNHGHAVGDVQYAVRRDITGIPGHCRSQSSMRNSFLIAAALLIASSFVEAQPNLPPKKGAPPGSAAEALSSPESARFFVIERNFFAPELVMQNQRAIGLTEEQKTAIRGEMQEVMAQFTDLQWRESAEIEALTPLITSSHPDEKESLARFDKLLDIENQIKRLHMRMLIRIKNQLTAEQQAKLHGLGKTEGPPSKGLK